MAFLCRLPSFLIFVISVCSVRFSEVRREITQAPPTLSILAMLILPNWYSLVPVVSKTKYELA